MRCMVYNLVDSPPFDNAAVELLGISPECTEEPSWRIFVEKAVLDIEYLALLRKGATQQLQW